MREGRVYVCKWEKLPDGGGYRGVVERPKLVIDGGSLDAIAWDLTDRIAGATGDCEAVIEFEPPVVPGGGDADWFKDGLINVGSNSFFQFANPAEVVEGSYCERCKWPLGGRSNATAAVESMSPGDVTFSSDRRAEGVHVLLLSERLLEALSDADREAFDVRPVKRGAGKRKQFVEVVPKHFVPEVWIESVAVGGWHCEECGRVYAGHGPGLGYCIPAIARDRVPPGATFFIGCSTHYDWCMKAGQWQKMKAVLRKASVSSNPVAVVGAGQITQRVSVPEIEEIRARYADDDR